MYFIGISTSRCDANEASPLLKTAILKKEGNEVSIESLHDFPEPSSIVNLFYNLANSHPSKEMRICSGLSGSQVFIRNLLVPLAQRHKVLAALPFQCEAILPFPLESAVVCPQLRQIGKQQTSVTLYATIEASLQEHIGALKNFGLNSDAISCEPVALARFAHFAFPNRSKILAFHLEGQSLLYTLSRKEEVLFSQTLFLKERASLSIELQKLEIFLKERGMIDEHTPWLVAGEDAEELFAQTFSSEKLPIEDAKMRSHALAIGLALDGLASDSLSVQFSQGKFTPPHTKQKRKKLLLSYLAVCLIGTLLVASASALLIGKKKRLLVERLKEELPSEIALDPKNIEESLYGWETSLNKLRSSFPFHPTVPKVSDVLAWLSADPHFTSEDGGKKEGIEIKSLHYQLVKYPKIGEAGSPYTAMLSIDFTAETPRLARDFHEELLKGAHIANAKKEIRWQVQNQNYHTSFELVRGVAQ